MACQAFSADSFAALAGDSALPILMHHASAGDCLPTTSHAHNLASAGKRRPPQNPRYSLIANVRPVVTETF